MGNFAVQFSMKNSPNVTRMTFLNAFVAVMLLAGCAAQQHTPRHGTAPCPDYETAEQIRGMPPCQARVVQRSPCSVYLQTADGKGLYLGSPGSKADVNHFLTVLKVGQNYDLPDASLKNQRPTEP
jgi:hypothetical protein